MEDNIHIKQERVVLELENGNTEYQDVYIFTIDEGLRNKEHNIEHIDEHCKSDDALDFALNCSTTDCTDVLTTDDSNEHLTAKHSNTMESSGENLTAKHSNTMEISGENDTINRSNTMEGSSKNLTANHSNTMENSSENPTAIHSNISNELNTKGMNDMIFAQNPHQYQAGHQSKLNNTSDGKACAPMHLCIFCGRYFNKKGALTAHLRTHTGVETSYKTLERAKLQYHYQNNNHTMQNVTTDGTTIHVNQNINTTSDGTLHACGICGKHFKQKGALTVHLKIHTGLKLYQCHICSKSFTTKGSMQTHLQTHTGKKPYQCDICNKSLTTKGNLQTHLRKHTGEKPFECKLCNKAFITKANFQNHVRAHTGLKPYKCELCNKPFSIKYSLQAHLRTHAGEKPYKCDHCNVSFNQMARLKMHAVQTHSNQKLPP